MIWLEKRAYENAIRDARANVRLAIIGLRYYDKNINFGLFWKEYRQLMGDYYGR